MSSITPRVDELGQEPLVDDLADCLRQLDEVNTDAKGLVAGLSEAQFHWSPMTSHWSIAQCLVHLTIMGRVYVPVLDAAIADALAANLVSRGPYRYGVVERWFVQSTEPPPSLRLRTPVAARPLDDQERDRVIADFLAIQEELGLRIRAANGLDLARAKLSLPFAKALKMGLGSCFFFLAAHQRRHLWQGWQVRNDPGFPSA